MELQAEVRKATEEDVDLIYDIGRNVQEFATSVETTNFWPRSVLKNVIGQGDGWILVAAYKGEIVGFIICNYNSTFSKAVIENLYVKEGFRGAGVGKQLLGSLWDELKQVGCSYVITLVGPGDAAAGFYAKNGFARGKSFLWMDKVMGGEFQAGR